MSDLDFIALKCVNNIKTLRTETYITTKVKVCQYLIVNPWKFSTADIIFSSEYFEIIVIFLDTHLCSHMQ